MVVTRDNKPLILASASPRRRRLMSQAGYRFRVKVSDVKENAPRGLSASGLVRYLALKKAVAVSRQYPDSVVLGADTIVFINGKVVGKPRNRAHAGKILKELSGVWQKVYTGVAVVSGGGRYQTSRVAVSKVKMRHLNDKDILRASRKHLDKAGAYAVQERKDPFVEKIIGDFDNVVGLPMRLVRKLLSAG